MSNTPAASALDRTDRNLSPEERLRAAVDLLLEEGWDRVYEVNVPELVYLLNLPKHQVCETCSGEGFVSKLGAFTQDWLDEQFGGPGPDMDEFVEDYTRRGGPYDEHCPECRGNRVVTWEQLLRYEDEAQFRAEVEAERRMGA